MSADTPQSSGKHPRLILYKVEELGGAGLPAFGIIRVILEERPGTYKLIEGRGMGYRSVIRKDEIERNRFGLSSTPDEARKRFQAELEQTVRTERSRLRRTEDLLDKYLVELLKGNVNEPPRKADPCDPGRRVQQ